MQNLLTTLLQKEGQNDNTLKEAISMVNTKWELTRESKVQFRLSPMTCKFQLTAFQEYLQALAKDAIFQPNRQSYKSLHLDVEASLLY